MKPLLALTGTVLLAYLLTQPTPYTDWPLIVLGLALVVPWLASLQVRL